MPQPVPYQLAAAVVLAALVSGCGYFDKLKGTGFAGTREPVSGSLRGNADEAKPSGFFTDKRSDEIEKNLGGFE